MKLEDHNQQLEDNNKKLNEEIEEFEFQNLRSSLVLKKQMESCYCTFVSVFMGTVGAGITGGIIVGGVILYLSQNKISKEFKLIDDYHLKNRAHSKIVVKAILSDVRK